MAAVPIKVPSVGESISEGTLARWLKPDGSAVQANEPLFELESDKAAQVVNAPSAGVLKIQAQEGDTVEIGAVIGSIDPDATPSAAPAPAKGNGPTKAAVAPAPVAPPPPANEARPVDPTAAGSNGGGVGTMPLAPSVRRLVAETQVDPSQVEGTGRGGRL